VKIPDPFPYHALKRATVKPGDVVCVMSSRGQYLEVSDGEEVLVEPVKYGKVRGEVEPVGEGRIWSKKWGMLDIGDHLKKMNIEKEEADLAKRKAKLTKREPKLTKQEPKVDNEAPRVVSQEISEPLSLGDTLKL